MEFYRCAKCKLYQSASKSCQIMIPQMQGKINPEDYCSKCMPEIATCAVCGGGLLNPLVVVENDTVYTYCAKCLAQKLNNP